MKSENQKERKTSQDPPAQDVHYIEEMRGSHMKKYNKTDIPEPNKLWNSKVLRQLKDAIDTFELKA